MPICLSSKQIFQHYYQPLHMYILYMHKANIILIHIIQIKGYSTIIISCLLFGTLIMLNTENESFFLN